MKKSKKFIAGIVLIVIGIIGLFGLFGDTEDKGALAFGSFALLAGGIVLILLDKKKPKSDSSEPVQNNSVHTHSFTVAGVSFKNDDGMSRQSILRKMKFGDEPFVNPIISLKKYEFNGETAIGVYADGTMIGNVPKGEVQKVLKMLDKNVFVDCAVYGGGYADDGEKKNFGAKVTLFL